MQLKPNSILQNGKYRIESVLGQGGFGITYMAVQTALDRKVAIKEFFMKEHCERDEATSAVSLGTSGSREMVLRFKNKFIREAQTIAKMNHPHIVRIHDVFEENGTAYYVMEYHGSGSLLSHSLPLSSAEVIAHAKQISSALAYLHKRKVMHLDVKPANILVDEDGNAVLIDFGVSKRYDEEGHQTSSTPIGTSHGYAPIEQYSQTTLTFSPATDIYALGATMYKLLTGLTPPESSLLLSNPSLLSFPEDISSSLVALVRKCMRPVVDDRPQSIEEFLGLLKAAEVAMKAETESSESVTVEDETADEGVDDLVEGEKVADALSETDETEFSEQAEEQTPDQSSSSDSASDGPSGPASRKRRLWLWVTLIAAAVIGYFLFFMFFMRPSEYDATGYDAIELDPIEYDATGYDAIELDSIEYDATGYDAIELDPIEYDATGYDNGHGYVDLGLPSGLKWATCNVGASSPEDYGDYYAWGEVKTKSEYTEGNCSTYEKQIGNISGNPRYDVARAKWGGSWRMPTEQEFEELIDNCTWEWTTKGGHNGYKVTGPNGNSIFLPAAGYRYGAGTYYAESSGYYWSATPYESGTQDACGLYFYSGYRSTLWLYRYYGLGVRPVSD